MSVSVVVVHRHAMFAEGIAAALARFQGIVSVGSAADADDAIRSGVLADAVAMDVELPGAERAARELRRRGVRVVFIGGDGSGHGPATVSTDARVADLAVALNPPIDTPSLGDPSRLTHREREVLSLVAQGLAGKQVARQLGISPKTVERHKTKIFTKLAVPNAAAAVGVVVSAREGGDGVWSRSTT